MAFLSKHLGDVLDLLNPLNVYHEQQEADPYQQVNVSNNCVAHEKHRLHDNLINGKNHDHHASFADYRSHLTSFADFSGPTKAKYDISPPSVRTNLGPWLASNICGSHGTVESMKLHPVITFGTPQNFVKVKLVDDVTLPGTKFVSMADLNGEKLKKNEALIHWDATFNLNGGQGISMDMKAEETRVPFFIPCTRTDKLRLEIELDWQSQADLIRIQYGPTALSQAIYKSVDPSVEINGKATDVSKEQTDILLTRLPTFPIGIDRPVDLRSDSRDAIARKLLCHKTCRAKKCPPLDSPVDALADDEFAFAKANCRAECTGPSRALVKNFKGDLKDFNGFWWLTKPMNPKDPPIYIKPLPPLTTLEKGSAMLSSAKDSFLSFFGRGDQNKDLSPDKLDKISDGRPLNYPKGHFDTQIMIDDPFLKQSFQQATEVGILQYNRDGQEKWGFHVLTHKSDTDVLESKVVAMDPELTDPTEVKRWMSTETQTQITEGGPTVVYNYCREDGMINPMAAPIWNMKRVIRFDAPKSGGPVKEMHHYNRHIHSRSTGVLCDYTKVHLKNVPPAMEPPPSIKLEYEKQAPNAPETAEKQLTDATVFNIYHACLRHDRGVWYDIGTLPDSELNRPRDSIGKEVSPSACLNPGTAKRIDDYWTGNLINVTEQGIDPQDRKGIEGDWWYNNTGKITQPKRIQSEWFNEARTLKLFEMREDYMRDKERTSRDLRWHIAPIIDIRNPGPIPFKMSGQPEHDIHNPGVQLMTEMFGSYRASNSPLPPIVMEAVRGNREHISKYGAKYEFNGEENNPDGTAQGVMFEMRLLFTGNIRDYYTQNTTQMMKEQKKIEDLEDELNRIPMNDEDKRSAAAPKVKEYMNLMLKRHASGKWAMKNKDSVLVAVEHPLDSHATSPDKVRRWLYFNPDDNKITNENPDLEFTPDYHNIVSTIDSGKQFSNYQLVRSDGDNHSRILFDYEANGMDDIEEHSVDAINPNEYSPTTGFGKSKWDSSYVTPAPPGEDYWPGQPYYHKTRTPCDSKQFTNGARCQSGPKLGMQLMRQVVDRCIIGTQPCVRTYEDDASQAMTGEAVETCHTLLPESNEEPMDGTERMRTDPISRKRKEKMCHEFNMNSGTKIKRCQDEYGCEVLKNAQGQFVCELDPALFGPDPDEGAPEEGQPPISTWMA